MSDRAIKVNEFIEKAADFCLAQAREIRNLVNEDVQTPEFLMAADEAADDLEATGKEIRDLTLEEQEV
jgi:hypothetical protein